MSQSANRGQSVIPRVKLVTVSVVILLLQSCAGAYRSSYSIAIEAGLGEQLIVTDEFEHQVFVNAKTGADRVHVYIHGDGQPWHLGRRPAVDPTPRNPLLLSMMSLDKQASVYLGRPCYYGAGPESLCDATVWTSARYSQQLVDSMVQALGLLVADDQELILIGYSGGAVIAALMARQLENAVGLITVAGNLDIDLWTDTFALLPLAGSVNPTRLAISERDIKQLHLVGGKDTIVPLAVTMSYVSVHGGDLRTFPDFSHACCWDQVWQQVLRQFEQELGSADFNIQQRP